MQIYDLFFINIRLLHDSRTGARVAEMNLTDVS